MEDDLRSIKLQRLIASATDINIYASGNVVPRDLYEVVEDKDPGLLRQTRKVLLNRRWRTTEDFFEVDYTTVKSYCPKCVGLEVLDDISFNVRGELKIQRNEKLLLQNVEKWTITEINSNPFHSFVGTSLTTLIGNRVSDPNFLVSKIIQEITTALQKLRDMQSQYEESNRAVTDGEMLESVNNVDVQFDKSDPTILRAFVTVMARSGKTAQFTQLLQLPEG